MSRLNRKMAIAPATTANRMRPSAAAPKSVVALLKNNNTGKPTANTRRDAVLMKVSSIIPMRRNTAPRITIRKIGVVTESENRNVDSKLVLSKSALRVENEKSPT